MVFFFLLGASPGVAGNEFGFTSPLLPTTKLDINELAIITTTVKL